MNKSLAIYIRVWQTAFDRGELKLPYATEAEAVRMRLNLYRAVKDYREAKDSPNPEFTRMLNQLEMAINPTEGNTFTLIIRKKELNPLLLSATAQLDSLL